MRVLIVGGNSALGTALKPVLSRFCEVITAGRRDCDLKLDLNDAAEAIALPKNLDALVHTAAHYGGNDCAEILEAESINVLGTLKLCQAAVQERARHFIFISTIHCCLKENSPYFNIYALSKRHAEDVIRFICSTHLVPLTILRPSQIYGIHQTHRKPQPFFYQMLDKARKGEDIVLYGTHDARRNFIYLDDLTEVISRVVKHRITGIFSCQHPEDVTYSQVVSAAYKAFQTNGSMRFDKDQPEIPDNVFEKDDTLYQQIGFYPQTNMEEGLAQIARLTSSTPK